MLFEKPVSNKKPQIKSSALKRLQAGISLHESLIQRNNPVLLRPLPAFAILQAVTQYLNGDLYNIPATESSSFS